MPVKATARPAVPSIWSATRSSAWAETWTRSPSCTSPTLGHPAGCHLNTLQRLLRSSLAQHLNPSSQNPSSSPPPHITQGTQQGRAEPTALEGELTHTSIPQPHQGRGMPAQKMTYFASLHYFIRSVKLWHKCMMNSVFTFTQLLCWLWDQVFLGVIQPFKNYVSTQQ